VGRVAEPETQEFVNGLTESSVRSFVDGWADAWEKGDADSFAHLYAPVVETYFTKHNVGPANVGEEMRRVRSRYPTIARYVVTSDKISISEDRAVVEISKEWDVIGHDRFSGAESGELRLIRFGSEWQISSERDLVVKWTKHAPAAGGNGQ
jgi:hypothetical protein